MEFNGSNGALSIGAILIGLGVIARVFMDVKKLSSDYVTRREFDQSNENKDEVIKEIKERLDKLFIGQQDARMETAELHRNIQNSINSSISRLSESFSREIDRKVGGKGVHRDDN